LLDEVGQGLQPGPDAVEYAQARQLLRQGSKPPEVVILLATRRAEAFEKLVQERLEQVATLVPQRRPSVLYGRKPLSSIEREEALALLRQGRSVEDVIDLLERLRRAQDGDN
jgi:hypothetical protein